MHTKKDFKKWHDKKVKIDEKETRVFFHEREVWFCFLGINVGFEQDGSKDKFLRPVIILKKFNNDIFWGIPLTKKNKKGLYYFRFKHGEKRISSAILSQIRLIDAKRLIYKVGSINDEDFKEMKKRLISLLN